MSDCAASLTERLIQAAVDYETGRCSRRELSEARAVMEAAIIAAAYASAWQPIETAPQTEWGKGLHVLVWTDKIIGNVFNADLHNLPGGEIWVNLGNFNGNAVEHWGVTHWMPIPARPSVTSTDRGGK